MQRRYMFVGLVLALLVGAFFYLRTEQRTQIDFEQVEPIPGYKMEMREPPLRMAMISVLNHARTEGYQSQMVRSLGRLLGRPVLLLHRRSYAEINQLLAKGDADVAFLSSGAYMVYGKKEDVRLLAMPERGELLFLVCDCPAYEQRHLARGAARAAVRLCGPDELLGLS